MQIEPDDGTVQNPGSYQVSTDSTLTLTWSTVNATSVTIDPLSTQPASGSVTLPTQEQTYTLIAKADDGSASAPVTISISTHAPGETVSPHTDVNSGVAALISFNASKNGQSIISAASGDEIDLIAVVSDGADAVTINGSDGAMSELSAGNKQAVVQVTVAMPMTGDFDCQVMQNGAQQDSGTVHVDITPAVDATGAGAGTSESGGATVAGTGAGEGTASGQLSAGDAPTLTSFSGANEKKETTADTGTIKNDKGGKIDISFKASEGTAYVIIDGGGFAKKRFEGAEGDTSDNPTDDSVTYTAVAYSSSDTPSDPLSFTVTIDDEPATFTFVEKEGELFSKDHSWDVEFIKITAGVALKISGDVNYKYDSGEAAPTKESLVSRLTAGTVDLTNALGNLPNLDSNENVVWKGDIGISNFKLLATSGATEGSVAEFTLYDGKLSVPGEEELVGVEVTVALFEWDGKKGEIEALVVEVAAAFPLIKVSIEGGKIECELAVEFSVSAGVDLAELFGKAVIGAIADVMAEVFPEVTVPLLVIAILADVLGGFIIKVMENKDDIANATTIISGFKVAFQAQLIACTSGADKIAPGGDSDMAKMVQAQGIQNALNSYATAKVKMQTHDKITSWVQTGVDGGGTQADLAQQALDEFNKQLAAAAGDIAAKAYANGYNAIANAMVNSMQGFDPMKAMGADQNNYGDLDAQQDEMREKLGIGINSKKVVTTYDSYLAFYKQKYGNKDASQCKEIPYTEDEWNALSADDKSTYKTNPNYETQISDLHASNGISDGPSANVRDQPGDPNYESGVESYHSMDPEEYADSRHAFAAVLISGDQRISGRAMDVSADGKNGTFLQNGKLITFNPPSHLEQPPPATTTIDNSNSADGGGAKAGCLQWNNPDKTDSIKYDAEGGYKAQLHINGKVYVGMGRMGGGEGTFRSDDGTVVCLFKKPAYLTKL